MQDHLTERARPDDLRLRNAAPANSSCATRTKRSSSSTTRSSSGGIATSARLMACAARAPSAPSRRPSVFNLPTRLDVVDRALCYVGFLGELDLAPSRYPRNPSPHAELTRSTAP